MALKDALMAELQHEATLTRKMLERVPMDKKDWAPHAKSMTAGKLATHIAETPYWIVAILGIDHFDFARDYSFSGKPASSTEELVKVHETTVAQAIVALKDVDDGEFAKTWTVGRNGQVMMSLPKAVAIRGWAYNHLYHHRGQLSVYLRLLDVPVPGIYGPSADER